MEFSASGPGTGTVLVANRGEIAVRIIRSCRDLGLRTVAVYSDADAHALHVRLADEAHRIGPAPARDSYLDVDALLAAAKAGRADAVHPGYGMLSEDAAFAAAVTSAGLTFIGPPAGVIASMGDKVAARRVARECGVPIPPGSAGAVDGSDPAAAAAVADRLGWPVMVKASFGGGGRGMRVVHDAEGLAVALAAAAREARAAFGRPEVHIERYLEHARHVEVQILADAHGTVLAIGDRDCSVQRRHQKLIEEAPAPNLPASLRTALRDAATRIAREVGYVGAGTVEFLVLPAGRQYFFLEMNTRLQVEHGVTEMVTGIDLVAAQLRIAAGVPLWFSQDDVRVGGHAVQARIAAEDPWEQFRPAPGLVRELRLPQGPWLRSDMGLESGDAVAAEYDSMFGKVLAWGSDRDTARRRLIGALGELRVTGVPTTAPYLRRVLASASFAAATHDTGSVASEWPADPADRPEPQATPERADASTRPVRQARIATDRGPVEVAIWGRPRPPGAAGAIGGRRPRAATGPGLAPSGPRTLPVAPMDATVVAVPVVVGQPVQAGDVLIVIEAMKMEMEVRSDRSGTVAEVRFAPGDPVEAGELLARVES